MPSPRPLRLPAALAVSAVLFVALACVAAWLRADRAGAADAPPAKSPEATKPADAPKAGDGTKAAEAPQADPAKPAAGGGADPNLVGVLPLGADGKPLNLDFETGDLTDWTATGEAFKGQPVKGDLVAPRRGDMRSGHQGRYWVGGYEVAQDAPKGRLVSRPFKVTHPWASFLVGGGSGEETRVEIVLPADNAVLFKASGNQAEDMARAVVDLRKVQGREIVIRIIDGATGAWGHVNFDDFRFHAAEPKFPPGAVSKPKPPPPPLDEVKFAGLKPEEAARAMTLPPGFKATVFAAEPDVAQPVAMTIDARGRVWIAEAHTYPKKAPEGKGKDRIVIHEDTDGDGKADRRAVFVEGLNLVSGLEVGFGGVWVGQAPQLLFIPDKDGDDKPDGEPEVLLDGWGYQDTHETLNAFTWGPDGWLYGCHGVFTHSNVGKPGAPDDQRTKINAGVWRYHPVKKTFEVFAHGTSNPWGVDFNDRGQAFVTACVIPHLFHIIQGARYHRQSGQHFNPYTYDDIKTCADHRHWAGAGGPHAGNNRSDAAGGGHAHCGAMIYLADAFPAQYRDTLLFSNIHGNRLNNDLLVPAGSGYVGKHGADFLKANDKWSRMINLRTGPDGSVYLIDWYDQQACHLVQPEKWDRSNGRVYKIGYTSARLDDATAALPKDLNTLPTMDLAKLQAHRNDYYVRHARRILQERHAADPAKTAEAKALLSRALFTPNMDVPPNLRFLWAVHVLGGADERTLLTELEHPDPWVRGWVIQLACEDTTRPVPPALLAEFVRLAKEDDSQVVRLYLASACQRLPAETRWDILKALVAHEADAADPNLPLMYWYALEPLVPANKAKALALAASGKIPLLREYTTRRIAAAAK